MDKLNRNDLYSLEDYARQRDEFRAKIIAHKKPRRISAGPNLNLYFEDRLTMQYQIQEMLRIERIFEADAIEEELNAYNPLIPNGRNWKATMMLEYDDVEDRKVALTQLVGIENLIWVQVDGCEKSYAIADEDLERSDDTKTSAVHFVRFELSDDAVSAAKGGAQIAIGVDHKNYAYQHQRLTEAQRTSLVADLD